MSRSAAFAAVVLVLIAVPRHPARAQSPMTGDAWAGWGERDTAWSGWSELEAAWSEADAASSAADSAWSGWSEVDTAGAPSSAPIAARDPDPAAVAGAGDGRIDGFMDLSWHADSAKIVRKLGPPIAITRRKSGYSIFSYTPMFLSRDGFLNLWVDPELGLLRASYEAVTTRCTDYMRQIIRELRRRHPRVPSRTQGNVRLERLRKSLCSAAVEDGAELATVWTDRDGNLLWVGAGPKDPALRMVGVADDFRKRTGGRP